MDENNFNNQGENQNGYGEQQPYQQNDFNSSPYGNQSEPFAQQPSFTPPPQYGYTAPPMEPEMSVKDWIITFLIMMVPCVNIVMIFVWAFSNTNKTRANFFKAYLIIMAVMMVLSLILSVALGSVFAVLMDELMYAF